MLEKVCLDCARHEPSKRSKLANRQYCKIMINPLCLSFVDYEKDFNLAELEAVLSSSREQGINLISQDTSRVSVQTEGQ